jgi:hypothetical protein
VTPFCCDCHNDQHFDLQSFLPGYLYTGALTIIQMEPRTKVQYRPTWERHALDMKLIAWIKEQVSHDKLYCAPYFILSKAKRETLVKAKFETITSPSTITHMLQETAEWERAWADKLYSLICDFQKTRPPKPVKGMNQS